MYFLFRGKSARIKMADRMTDDYVIKSQVNAPLKTCFKTFKILLKRAVRMRNMPFPRHKFQKCSGGAFSGIGIKMRTHNTVGPPMASALPPKKIIFGSASVIVSSLFSDSIYLPRGRNQTPSTCT